MLAEDQVDIFVLGDVNEAELVPLFKQLPFTPREEAKPRFSTINQFAT